MSFIDKVINIVQFLAKTDGELNAAAKTFLVTWLR